MTLALDVGGRHEQYSRVRWRVFSTGVRSMLCRALLPYERTSVNAPRVTPL